MNWLDGDRSWLDPEVELSEEERRQVRRATHREFQVALTALVALVLWLVGLASGAHPITAIARAAGGALLATYPIRWGIWTLWWLSLGALPKDDES